mgnify:CR=1 FL=1
MSDQGLYNMDHEELRKKDDGELLALKAMVKDAMVVKNQVGPVRAGQA